MYQCIRCSQIQNYLRHKIMYLMYQTIIYMNFRYKKSNKRMIYIKKPNKRKCLYCFQNLSYMRKQALFCSNSCRVRFCRLQRQRKLKTVNSVVKNNSMEVYNL